MNTKTLKWVNSLGGPLLLLSGDLIGRWQGADSDDYDRACAGFEEGYGLIDVGRGHGLVISEPLATTWIKLSSGSGVIAQWICAENEDAMEAVLADLQRRDHVQWTPTEIELKVSHPKFVLFDSAFSAGDLPADSLKIELSHGVYALDEVHYSPDPHTELMLYRLRRKK